jgi:cobalt-precorrin 5A hydrolase
MRAALVSLSREGAALHARLTPELGEVALFVHRDACPEESARTFDSIVALTAELFDQYDALIYAAPCGVVVRALAGCLRHKTTDPAVVVVDVFARWAVSLLSGHEGGANALAFSVANALEAEPVITTTTEARKRVIAGVGCRRGTSAAAIEAALVETLERAGIASADVRLLASAAIKSDEPGLREAAAHLGLPLRFVAMGEIGAARRAWKESTFVRRSTGVAAVAEASALLAGRRTQLIWPKTVFPGITVALVRECSTWSGLVQADPTTEPDAPNSLSRPAT